MAGCASSETFCQYLEGLANGRRAAKAPVQEPAAWEFTVAQCVLTIKTGNAVHWQSLLPAPAYRAAASSAMTESEQ